MSNLLIYVMTNVSFYSCFLHLLCRKIALVANVTCCTITDGKSCILHRRACGLVRYGLPIADKRTLDVDSVLDIDGQMRADKQLERLNDNLPEALTRTVLLAVDLWEKMGSKINRNNRGSTEI